MLSMAVLHECERSKTPVLHEETELSLYDEEALERLLEEEDFWRRAESLQACSLMMSPGKSCVTSMSKMTITIK